MISLPTTSPTETLLLLPPLVAVATCGCLLLFGVAPRTAASAGGLFGVIFVAAIVAVLS